MKDKDINLSLPDHMAAGKSLYQRTQGLMEFTKHVKFKPGSLNVYKGLDCMSFFYMSQCALFKRKLEELLPNSYHYLADQLIDEFFAWWEPTIKPRDGNAVLMANHIGGILHVGTYIQGNILHFDREGPKFHHLSMVPFNTPGLSISGYRYLRRQEEESKPKGVVAETLGDKIKDALNS